MSSDPGGMATKRGGFGGLVQRERTPEVKRNLIAAAGALFRLPRKLPRSVAMELALTGRLDFPAERAHQLGWTRASPSHRPDRTSARRSRDVESTRDPG